MGSLFDFNDVPNSWKERNEGDFNGFTLDIPVFIHNVPRCVVGGIPPQEGIGVVSTQFKGVLNVSDEKLTAKSQVEPVVGSHAVFIEGRDDRDGGGNDGIYATGRGCFDYVLQGRKREGRT